MPRRVFIDAVTLNHFASVDQLDLLRRCCRAYDSPMWVEEVYEEVQNDANPWKHVIEIGCDWLGVPEQPSETDLGGIYVLQVALNEGLRPPTKHLGEAQSIYFADAFQGGFVTDDGAAFDLAHRRLGPGRVRDTIDLLQSAVAMDDLDARTAADLANGMIAAGRSFKFGRPQIFDARLFAP